MTNRQDYTRMRPGDSKALQAAVQSRRDMAGRAKGMKAQKQAPKGKRP
jgi:hypothetical protein